MIIAETLKLIKEMLANNGKIESHNPVMLAQTYADYYQVVNKRLKKCLNYIQNGLTPQALDEAQNEPVLIDLCKELTLTEEIGWRKLCLENKWQIPEALDINALNHLEKASTLEVFSKPLLKKLRRANNKGNFQECVWILRELVQKDPENSEWKPDLIEFEKFHMRQLRKKFEKLREEKKFNKIANLFIELQKQWIIPMDDALFEDIHLFLKKKQKEKISNQEQTLIPKIKTAYQEKDYNGLEKLIKDYEKLKKNKQFQSDKTLRPIYETALKWFNQKEKEKNKKNIYAEKLNRLNTKIAERSHDGIKSLWEELLSYNYPMPENLESQVQESINKATSEKIKNEKKKRIRNLLLFIFVVTGLLIFLTGKYYNKIEHHKLAYLEQAFAAQDLEQVYALLTEMETQDSIFSNFFRKTEMNKQRARANELKKSLDQKQATFIAIMARLEELQKKEFKEQPAIIERLLKDAMVNAVTSDEVGRLTVVRNTWEEKQMGDKSMAKNQLDNILRLLAEEFEYIDTHSTSDLAKDHGRIQKIETIIAQGMKVQNASVEMKNRLTKFNTHLESIKSLLVARKNEIVKIQKADSLEGYLKELKIFSTAFPNDAISQGIEPVNAMEPFYHYLLANPMTENPNNLFWYPTAKDIRNSEHNITIHKRKVAENIKRMERTERFVDLWECIVSRPNRKAEKWYFSGEPSKEYVNGIKCYTGIAYILSPKDSQPEFEANSVIIAHVQGLKRMPHCFFIEQMMSKISNNISVENIIQQMPVLYHQNFSPILKLHLMNFLIKEMFTLVGRENALAFTDIADDLKQYSSGVHWVCSTNTKYKIEAKKADSILNANFAQSKVLNNYLSQREIQKICLKRSVKWVGVVDLEDTRILHLKIGKAPNEIWVVRDFGSPQLFVSEEQVKGKKLKHLDHKGYLPGEPLFAPYDNNTTRDILSSISTDLSLSGNFNIQWPSCWPVNLRHL